MLGIAKGGKYDLISLNVNEVINSVLKFFGRTNKDIIINEDLANDLKSIEADKTQMDQVILNEAILKNDQKIIRDFTQDNNPEMRIMIAKLKQLPMLHQMFVYQLVI